MNILEGVKYQELNKGQFIKGSNFTELVNDPWAFKKASWSKSVMKIARNHRKISGIYLLSVGKGFYIGSSVNLYTRLKAHVYSLKKGTNGSTLLQYAYTKYKYVRLYILEFCAPEDLLKTEQHYIDTLFPKYNIRRVVTSNRGGCRSEKTKENQSIRMKAAFTDPLFREKHRLGLDEFKASDRYLEYLKWAKERARLKSNAAQLKKDKARKDKLESGHYVELFWKTGKEKNTPMLRKVNPELVAKAKEVKRLSKDGVRPIDIREIVGVSKLFVENVRSGKMYKWVTI